MLRAIAVIVALTLSPVTTGQSDTLLADPPEAVDEPTQVLVLGSPHLSTLGGDFDPAMLEGLNRKLVEFAPDAVATERLPGGVIEQMRASEPVYDAVVDQMGLAPVIEHAERARTALEMTVGEVRAELVERLTARFLPAGDDQQLGRAAENHERLILLYAAAYDMESALLHWRYLRDGDSEATQLPGELVEYLDSLQENRASESRSIGVTVARTLGHDRVWPIDDHLDKDMVIPLYSRLQSAINSKDAIQSQVQALQQRQKELMDRARRSGELLPAYRTMNSAAFLRRDLDRQWLLWLRTDLPRQMDRARLALWEVRNLNMASHVRRVAAHYPGGRVLVVVGLSHKTFLDAYLQPMLGIEIVDATRVLGEPRAGDD